MSVSNPSAATASQPKSQSPDIEQLVGWLGSLMPLLLQFQSQTQEQPFQAGNVVVPNPALDRQAAENLIGDIIAASRRTLSTHPATHPRRRTSAQRRGGAVMPVQNNPPPPPRSDRPNPAPPSHYMIAPATLGMTRQA